MRIKKRLFVGLMLASMILLVLISGIIWYIQPYVQINYYQQAFKIAGLLGIGFLLLIALGIGGIVFTILWARPIPILQRFIRLPINLLFPLTVWLGKIFDVEKEAVERSFIEVNNQLVRAKLKQHWPERVLLLAPHCLQQAKCPHKITFDLANCRRCGNCQVAGLLEIAARNQLELALVTGGTLARQVVRKVRPELIIAIACERDLTSGIQDCYPIPVFGILNQRPEGPCINTCVALEDVEAILRLLHQEIEQACTTTHTLNV